MKAYNLLGLFCLGVLGLTSCANNTNYYNSQVKPDLVHETWLKEINLNPNQWTTNTDDWFVTGKPSNFERSDMNAPYSKAISTMSVRVPDYTKLKVDGRMHVQIVGLQDHNSAFVFGPNDAVREVIIEVNGDTLFIHEPKNCNGSGMDQVIVRLGIRNLQKLTTSGNVEIEGRDVSSDSLSIDSSSMKDTALKGSGLNLSSINQMGYGNVTVLGAETPVLNIKTAAKGCVNVSGRVGIHQITNNGGTIHILGADSDALSIAASGPSYTSIVGYVNLKKLVAGNSSQVYAYWVNSNGAYVTLYENAHVGLAGAIKNLNVDASNMSRFDGQYLRGENVYVRTRDWSHANVNSSHKLFAAALDSSSIYFFGSPNIVSRYTARDGIVIPVWNDTPNLPTMGFPPPANMNFTPGPIPAKPARHSYKGDGALQ